MRYLDTSLLISALTNERDTEIALSLMAEDHGQNLAVSDWSVTEVSSALSMKVRRGDLSRGQADAALNAFRSMLAESFQLLEVSRRHFPHAAKLADQHTTGLRSAAALHLAVAEAHGALVCTRDHGMATAAKSLGIDVRLLA